MSKITRRAALAAIPACGLSAIVPAVAASSAEPHPDAELVRLWAEWQRTETARKPLAVEANQLFQSTMDAWWASGGKWIKDNEAEFMAHCERTGLVAAEDAVSVFEEEQIAIERAIRATPAVGLAGLGVKLAVLRSYLCIKDDEPRDDQDWDDVLFNEFSDEVDALAAKGGAS